MIANMTSYVLARRVRASSIYEALLVQDGVAIAQPSRVHEPVLALVGSRQPATLGPGMSGEEVLLRCAGTEAKHVHPVVDAHNRLLGIVTQEELGVLTASPELLPLTTAFDLMRSPQFVPANADLAEVVDKMLASGLRELPVTDEQDRVLGCIDDQSVMQAYRKPRPA